MLIVLGSGFFYFIDRNPDVEQINPGVVLLEEDEENKTSMQADTVFNKRRRIIGSHWGSADFVEENLDGGHSIYRVGDYGLFDLVNSSVLGARKGGGEGAASLSFYDTKASESIELQIDRKNFSYITDGAGEDIALEQLSLRFPFGSLDFLNKKDMQALGEGDFSLQIQKESEEGLNEYARSFVEGRPMLHFEMSVDGKNIEKLDRDYMLLKIPYDASEDEDINQLVVYKIDDLGRLESLISQSIYLPSGYRQNDSSSGGYVQALIKETGTYAVGRGDNQVSYDAPDAYDKGNADFVYARDILHHMCGNFEPDWTLTKNDAVYALYRMSGQGSLHENWDFKGVKESRDYPKAIDWAVSMGFADQKMQEERMGDYTNLNRQEFALMLAQYVERVGNAHWPKVNLEIHFSDEAEIDSTAREAMSLLQEAGIVEAGKDGEFAPQDDVTRVQAAQMIRKTMECIFEARQNLVPLS